MTSLSQFMTSLSQFSYSMTSLSQFSYSMSTILVVVIVNNIRLTKRVQF